jgi:uncharacterized protein YbbC (DUF1343 family)
MPSKQNVVPGILGLEQCALFKGSPRVLLLSHAAALTPSGATAVDWVRASGSCRLVGVMAPEHGFMGHAAAGMPCRSFHHPVWNLPVYSLYGNHRVPQRAWLHKADILLVDLQDLGYRPYTYVSTLLYALQAAARYERPVVVADRPIPLPKTMDGPMLEAPFTSFVGAMPTPLCYGMTPGETARWIKVNLVPDVELTVLPMQGFRRSPAGMETGLPWVSPSPSIRSRDTAVVYPATVGLEGLPHIDHGRRTSMPFQLIGAPWIDPDVLATTLSERHLAGVAFHPHVYVPSNGGRPTPGIRLTVRNASVFRPVETMVHVLHALTRLYGRRRVWLHRDARPGFFDQLMGTDQVRKALMDGSEPADVISGWDYAGFLRQRKSILLYR